MIILRDKLFSRPKGKEETDHQKKDRKKSAKMIAATGTVGGAMIGGAVGDVKGVAIRAKGMIKARNIADKFNNEVDQAYKWTSNAMNNAKNPKEVLDYATKKIEERGAKARKDINRITKVANRSANKATLKSLGKGAVIGTAIAAPLAYAANKKIKKNNENLNAKRRGIKD